ncbi:unnamed protein product [Discosporangium mesarthrocarpum]
MWRLCCATCYTVHCTVLSCSPCNASGQGVLGRGTIQWARVGVQSWREVTFQDKRRGMGMWGNTGELALLIAFSFLWVGVQGQGSGGSSGGWYSLCNGWVPASWGAQCASFVFVSLIMTFIYNAMGDASQSMWGLRVVILFVYPTCCFWLFMKCEVPFSSNEISMLVNSHDAPGLPM